MEVVPARRAARALRLGFALPLVVSCASTPSPNDESRTTTTITATWSSASPSAVAPPVPLAPAATTTAAMTPSASALVVRASLGGDVVRASVWRVTTSGAAARVPFAFPDVGVMSVQGTTAPVPSRDGRRIAFVKDHGVSILDVATLAARPILPHAPAGADVLVTAWSRDGGDVLTVIGKTHRLISVATGGAVDVALSGEFVGWLPDGEALTLSDDGRVLTRVTPGVTGGAVVYRSPTYLVQVVPSPDGKQIAAGTSVSGADTVVRVDLSSGTATTLAASTGGHSLQNPWPTFSPSGAKLGWLEGPPLAVNEAAERVAFDGASPVDAGGAKIQRFHFLDDATLVLETEDALLVVDAATGAMKARTAVDGLPP